MDGAANRSKHQSANFYEISRCEIVAQSASSSERKRSAYLFDIWMNERAWISDLLRRLDTRLAKSHTAHISPGGHLDGDGMARWRNRMAEGRRWGQQQVPVMDTLMDGRMSRHVGHQCRK